MQGHHARSFAVRTGEVQGEHFVELSHRQAYHDLLDPQGGFRTGTQLNFLEASVQYREDRLKFNQLDLLSVNSSKKNFNCDVYYKNSFERGQSEHT